MTVDKDTFLPSTKKNYKWPVQVPLRVKPAQPPKTTKTKNFYITTLVEPYCHCDAHTYDPQMGQYKQLAEKEKLLYKEMDCLQKQMAALASTILDNECDNDDVKMETFYQTDYNKRGLELRGYIKLMAAIDAPGAIPFDGVKKDLFGGYRDPTSFRSRLISRPGCDASSPLTFEQTPVNVCTYMQPKVGRTEYQDNYNKVATNMYRAAQQFKEPSPSSRRRADEKNT